MNKDKQTTINKDKRIKNKHVNEYKEKQILSNEAKLSTINC